jgi:hypothetical protein
MRLGKPGEGYICLWRCLDHDSMSEGRRVREWSKYEWKIRNELPGRTTGGISSQAFGR